MLMHTFLPGRLVTVFFGLIVAGLLAGSGLDVGRAEPAGNPGAYLFSSFRGDGDGLHLAYSYDARDWTDLGRTFLTPVVGSKLFRDAQILRGPDGLFHMVWTTGWHDLGVGYATSPDLVHWSAQKFLPLMETVPGTQLCWAPELFYDDRAQQYILYWSSAVPRPGFDQPQFRAYYVLTKDFATFTEPKLLYDPGFNNIDTTMLRAGGKYVLVFKETDDQPAGKWGSIHAAMADQPLGPYTLSPNPPLVKQRAEGPATVTVGDTTLLYVDFYADHHYGLLATTDWKTWTKVTATANPVAGQRHGSILAVSTNLVRSLCQLTAAAAPKPSCCLWWKR